MSLFSEIVGLKGENLSSAVLAHILLRSPDARSMIIRKISDASPTGPIYVRNQFAAFCEEPTESDSAPEGSETHRGRLDLLVETDDTVIGIENKFFAPFQHNQPEGYVETLRVKAKAIAIAKLRETDFTPVLIVLAPARRRDEILNRLGEQKISNQAGFVAWEDLLAGLAELEGTSTVDRFLIRELTDFVNEQIGHFRDLDRLLPHLRKRWSERGTKAQRRFLNSFVWSLLDKSVKDSKYYSSGTGKDYYGWYLNPNPTDTSKRFWLGFLARKSEGREAALVIATKPAGLIVQSKGKEQFLQKIEVVDWTNWEWQCYEVMFGDSHEWTEFE